MMDFLITFHLQGGHKVETIIKEQSLENAKNSFASSGTYQITDIEGTYCVFHSRDIILRKVKKY